MERAKNLRLDWRPAARAPSLAARALADCAACPSGIPVPLSASFADDPNQAAAKRRFLIPAQRSLPEGAPRWKGATRRRGVVAGAWERAERVAKHAGHCGCEGALSGVEGLCGGGGACVVEGGTPWRGLRKGGRGWASERGPFVSERSKRALCGGERETREPGRISHRCVRDDGEPERLVTEHADCEQPPRPRVALKTTEGPISVKPTQQQTHVQSAEKIIRQQTEAKA